MNAARTDAALQAALDVFGARTGLVFPGARRGDFGVGAMRVMARRGIADAGRFAERLRDDRALVDELATELAVHESYFFREPAQFEAIRELVLPRLRGERAADKPLLVWSAGCARGEEAYSLAILLEQAGLLPRCRIHAGDISRAALADAARARYSAWAFRGTAVGLDPRYFRRRRAEFELLPRLRDRVVFQPLNLAAGPLPRPGPGASGFDLVLCRNVLIYFDATTIREVARRLHDALNDGGWLVTAPADPPLWDFAPFELHRTAGGIFYRRAPAAAAVPPGPPEARREQVGGLVNPAVIPRREAVRRRSKLDVSAAVVDEKTWIERISALASLDGSDPAERLAVSAIAQHPTVPEIRYLRAVLLLDLGRTDDALSELRRILYLDRSLVAAHLLLGAASRRAGRPGPARRAYSNALKLCAAREPAQVATLTDGETFGRLAELAAAELAGLPLTGPDA